MPCSFAQIGISNVQSQNVNWTQLPDIPCDEIIIQWVNSLNIATQDNPGLNVFTFGSTNLGSFTMPTGGNAKNIWVRGPTQSVGFIWKLN